MSRFTRKIRSKNQAPVQVIILAAGAGARTKSYEPRCLLKYDGKTLLEHQTLAIQGTLMKYEICIVGGVESNRLLKKIDSSTRFVENQKHDETNSGESLRLGVNNSLLNNILFFHGDLVFYDKIFSNVSFDKSFVLVDSSGKISEKEVGVTSAENKLTVMSYNLPVKWCQIAYFNKNETDILRKLLMRQDFDTKYLLTFEIINKMIELGAELECIDIKDNFIKEIDSLKDINSEDTNR
jgi:choline kinase